MHTDRHSTFRILGVQLETHRCSGRNRDGLGDITEQMFFPSTESFLFPPLVGCAAFLAAKDDFLKQDVVLLVDIGLCHNKNVVHGTAEIFKVMTA